MFRTLADAIVVVHFAFLVFVVVGGFVAIRVRRLRWAHVAAAVWGLAIVTLPGLPCPLTVAENWARRRGGQSAYSGGFIDRYVKGVIYPAHYTLYLQLAVAVCVLGSWALWWRAGRRRVGGAARPDAGT